MTGKPADQREKTGDDPRWRAVLARDLQADGSFFYSVETTGIYCRPSCAARRPNPEHVAFHASAAEAERAGYRPCRRCKPDQPAKIEQHAALVAALCRLLEANDQEPRLSDLATEAGMSPSHLHRLFKAATGVTPKAYATAHRAAQMRSKLDRGLPVGEAIYEAGYSSSSRFYEKSDQHLGMKPTAYSNGGTGAEIRFAVGECTLGSILVAVSDRGVCAVSLGDDPDKLVQELQKRFSKACLMGDDAGFEYLIAKVVAFVEEPERGCDLPLDLRGTLFQQRVWQALRKIPVGTTVTYSDIAEKIGAPRSVRAVAGACAANRLAVAIPCHRVVRRDGGLAGYYWGVERKRRLLEKEKKGC
jgi:AraC family transcriptional regulator, regulatory protein of adaptative response / methylated-DNA-[protein]-cysteine methyltransferase